MTYTITGCICEQETRRPIPGLIVRTVDRDDRFGHLLKTAVTGVDGRFRLVYLESEAEAAFHARPLVAVRVYAPPLRLLAQSPWADWGAEEPIDLFLPQAALGPLSPSRPDGVVEVRLRLARTACKLEKQGEFDVPRLPGYPNRGPVGAPALPHQLQHVVLPRRARVIGLEVEPGRPVRLPGPVHPLPVQETVPEPSPRPGDAARRRPRSVPLHPRYAGAARPYPEALVVQGSAMTYHYAQLVNVHVRPVQYDPAARAYLFYPNLRYRVRYEAPAARPAGQAQPVRRLTERRLAGMQACLDRSVTWVAKDAVLALDDGFSVEWMLPDLASPDMIIITDDYAYADGLPTGSAADSRPPDVPVPAPGAGRLLGSDGQGNGGGPVAAFQRLADWKMQRGVRTLVVTVTDILKQEYGDCTHGGFARDLPEVIRNFVKKAYEDWGFHYLLLGGSHKIVPMRYLLAYCTNEGKYCAWDFTTYTLPEQAETTLAMVAAEAVLPLIVQGQPPEVVADRRKAVLADLRRRALLDNLPPRACAADPAEAKIYLCHDWILGIPTHTTLLCTAHGQAIAFKQTPGDGQPGWYFATQEFAPSAGTSPTWYEADQDYDGTAKGTLLCNLVIEGSGDYVDDSYYWAFNPDRFIPSDLYYACLEENETPASSQPGPGHVRHDFDLSDNNLYGQFRWDAAAEEEVPVDNWVPTLPDVWVGRAPIDTGAEADAFVDKVLTYERLQTPEGEALDRVYLRRIVLAADVMRSDAHLAEQQPGWCDTALPEPGTFSHRPEVPCLLVHLQSDLVQRLAPQGTQAHVLLRLHDPMVGPDVDVPRTSSDGPGWHFCTLQGDDLVFVNEVAEYVKILGPVARVKPRLITWHFGPEHANDGATDDCERVRTEIFVNKFPSLFDVRRYYVEYLNFSPRTRQLTPPKIRAEIDLGCHFLFLRGHGGFNGLAGVWWYETEGFRPDFRNRDRYCIATAPSCFTAQPDYVRDGSKIRSLGETMVLQPRGGAVAYLGMTRLGLGHDQKQIEIVWRNLADMGRLGPAAGTPYHGDISLDDMWQLYDLILYGDPEMPVWIEPPESYDVVHPCYVDRSDEDLTICVQYHGQPLMGQRVTLLGGSLGRGVEPAYLRSKVTTAAGTAVFGLTNLPESVTSLTLTVSRDVPGPGMNFRPYWLDLPVVKFQSGWRRCIHCQALFYHYDAGEQDTHNDCPEHGPDGLYTHEPAPGEKYRVIANSAQALANQLAHSPKPPIEEGWKWCKKCQALFHAVAQSTTGGECYGGKTHDGSGSGEYALAGHPRYSHGSSEWRQCRWCRVLYREGEEENACFEGGRHEPTDDDQVYLVSSY